MRIEHRVTSLSWIPSEAMDGMMRVPMDLGLGHYDVPPPDSLADVSLEELRAADRFRFANDLRVAVEVEDGRIVDARYLAGGLIGATTMRIVGSSLTIPAVAYPDLQQAPTHGPHSVTFLQTAGGRTGAPLPRRVHRPPWVRLVAPTAWTTLSLTVQADGHATSGVAGASPFPRHWIYDSGGALTAKTGIVDYDSWARTQRPDETPWHDANHRVTVTAVESALERQLSLAIMRSGQRPELRAVPAGHVLVAQGTAGDEVFLLLDGVLVVDVDGEPLAEIGPGAVLGERAVLEGGRRTATLTAVSDVRVAVARADQIDRVHLAALAESHRREEQRT